MTNPEQEAMQLIHKSVLELDQLKPGVFDDYSVLTAIEKVEDLENPDEEKTFALQRVLLRSPYLDDDIEYGELIYEIQEHEINLNQGKNLMHWVLFGIIYFIKIEQDNLFLHDYLDYGRALLYQGKVDLFIKILAQLVSKAPLSQYLVSVLIEDFTRIGYLGLARKLEDRARACFGMEWEELLVDKLLVELENEKIDLGPLSSDLEAKILDLLSEENMVIEDDLEDTKKLYKIQEILDLVGSDSSSDEYVLIVPDLIQMVFDYWGRGEGISENFLKIIKILQETLMPELILLGDLLNIDHEAVFISEYFGKTQGYTFDHIREMATDSALAPQVRADAALMLTDVVKDNPDYKDQAIEVLSNLISEPEVDDSRNEEMVTWLIASLLDTECYELKEAITRAFNEDRVDPEVVKPTSFRGKWALEGILPQKKIKGKSILLTCQHCQRTRRYGYDYLLMDQDRKNNKLPWDSYTLFINRPFQCIKCGAKENYKVADVALFSLFPIQGFKTSPEDRKMEVSADIFFLSFDMTHILGYAEYQGGIRAQVIAGRKDRIRPLVLAEYYRVIGWFDEALRFFRQAYTQDPNDEVATLLLACAEHDFGDRDKAKELYQKVLVMERGDILKQMDAPATQNALRGLAQLKEGRDSPLPYPVNSKHVRLLDRIRQKKQPKRKK